MYPFYSLHLLLGFLLGKLTKEHLKNMKEKLKRKTERHGKCISVQPQL